MTNRDQRISAVQCNDNRVEYHPPDMALAYSQLAPFVSEAFAYLDCGETDKCFDVLRRAKNVVDLAGIWALTVHGPPNNPESG